MKIDISKLFYFCLQYALIITFHNFHLSFLKILKSTLYGLFRSSHPKVFLEKDVLKICSKFTGEHPCQSLISPFLKNTSGWLFLAFTRQVVLLLSIIQKHVITHSPLLDISYIPHFKSCVCLCILFNKHYQCLS